MEAARASRRALGGRASLAAIGLLPLLLAGAAGGEPEDEAAPPAEAVVLLHGLARTDRSMRPLEAYLEGVGYRVHNLGYPSTEAPPERLLDDLALQLGACCTGAPVLHFVGHSLGGVLIRGHLARAEVANLGRVVMLAPPNRGSEWVDVLEGSPLFEWVFGPTALELGTDEASLPNRLPPPDYELGVIAGTGSVNPLGSLVLPGEDDGTVSLERTHVEGMTDFLVVPSSHPFIMHSDEVARQVVHFLRHGRFDPPGPGPGRRREGP